MLGVCVPVCLLVNVDVYIDRFVCFVRVYLCLCTAWVYQIYIYYCDITSVSSHVLRPVL